MQQIMSDDQVAKNKQLIINLFNTKVKGRKANTSMSNVKHDGKRGHWLETQMGIVYNGDNAPDLLGFEMKNDTSSKTTFGDWSANYYIFSKDSEYNITRDEFLQIFGKPNESKNGRFSWSGQPTPTIKGFNMFGQKLLIDNAKNIIAIYSYSQDKRENKTSIIPISLQINNLVIARWDADKISVKLENKFNQNGWFKCLTNKNGTYTEIVFGEPMNYDNWLELVKSGDVFFDSGMYQGNNRPYSQWRANNGFWNKLITSRY